MSANPVLVETTRGARVESVHRGAVAVVDADGAVLARAGDIDRPVYPRSAVKPLQALVLVESGAADAFGFGHRQLALAQGSHGGEPPHVEGVRAMLAAAGLTEADLECGAHSPIHRPSAAALRRAGKVPTPLHNNCSGKHAAMLAAARHLGFATQGYVLPGHPVQRLVREALEGCTGVSLADEPPAVDGCSIPAYAVPLMALAHGFARFATGAGLPATRAAAARRLIDAALAEPTYVAGSGRFCTEMIRTLAPHVLVKSGAEGVFCAAVLDRGIGIALKCDDGATRASQVMMAAVLVRLFPGHRSVLADWANPPVKAVRGVVVGEFRPLAPAFDEIG